MNTRIRNAAVAAAVVLVLTGCSSQPAPASSTAAGCTPAHEGITTIKEGVLTVAQYDYPPFSTVEGGKLTGLEGDVLTRIAAMECLSIDIVQGDAAAMITSVSTGRADTTLGSWYRTKERAKVVRLGAPIVTSPLSVVSAKDVNTVDAIAALSSVGIVQGLVAAQDLQNLLGDKLKVYQTADAVFSDLQAGRIEAAVLGLGAAITQLELHPVDGASINPIEPDERIASTVSAGQTNFPVNLSNDALGTAMDEDLAQLRSSGELKDLAVKYGFPAEVADPGEPNEL